MEFPLTPGSAMPTFGEYRFVPGREWLPAPYDKTGQIGRFRYSLFKDVPFLIPQEGEATKSDPCLFATNGLPHYSVGSLRLGMLQYWESSSYT